MLEKRNYKLNRRFGMPDAMLNGQAVIETRHMRFGLASMARVGSGAVAIYNLLLLLGKAEDFAKTAAEVYRSSACLFGLLGVRPSRLSRFFESHYIPVRRAESYFQFTEKMTECRYCVLCSRTGRSIFSPVRVVTVENRNGEYRVYNRFDSRRCVYSFRTPAEICGDKNFILAYMVL